MGVFVSFGVSTVNLIFPCLILLMCSRMAPNFFCNLILSHLYTMANLLGMGIRELGLSQNIIAIPPVVPSLLVHCLRCNVRYYIRNRENVTSNVVS